MVDNLDTIIFLYDRGGDTRPDMNTAKRRQKYTENLTTAKTDIPLRQRVARRAALPRARPRRRRARRRLSKRIRDAL